MSIVTKPSKQPSSSYGGMKRSRGGRRVKLQRRRSVAGRRLGGQLLESATDSDATE